MQIHGAGVVCKDWSRMGTRKGLAGKSQLSFAHWLAERRFRLEDVVVVECTQDFDASVVGRALCDTHQAFQVFVDGVVVGDPVRRLRSVTTCLNRERVTGFQESSAS
eukprot:6462146-Amphidinium_carterae.5